MEDTVIITPDNQIQVNDYFLGWYEFFDYALIAISYVYCPKYPIQYLYGEYKI